jgi:hypothetical protein
MDDVVWWKKPLPWHLRALIVLFTALLMYLASIMADVLAVGLLGIAGGLVATLALKFSVKVCLCTQQLEFYKYRLELTEQELKQQLNNNQAQMKRNAELERQLRKPQPKKP